MAHVAGVEGWLIHLATFRVTVVLDLGRNDGLDRFKMLGITAGIRSLFVDLSQTADIGLE